MTEVNSEPVLCESDVHEFQFLKIVLSMHSPLFAIVLGWQQILLNEVPLSCAMIITFLKLTDVYTLYVRSW